MLKPLLLSAALALPLPAVAETAIEEAVSVTLLPGWRTERGTHMAGLRIALAPGWKTYWRAPGDAGIPPAFDWSQARNILGKELHWPAPEVFHASGMRSIGYTDSVVIPMEFALGDPDAPARAAGTVELGVCEEICVPVEVRFDTALPVTGERDPAIVAALVDRPAGAAVAGVTAVTCRLAPSAEGLRLTARIAMPPAGGEEVVVVETGDPAHWVSAARTRREGGSLTAEVEIVAPSGGALSIDRAAMRFTVLGQGAAVDLRGCDPA